MHGVCVNEIIGDHPIFRDINHVREMFLFQGGSVGSFSGHITIVSFKIQLLYLCAKLVLNIAK